MARWYGTTKGIRVGESLNTLYLLVDAELKIKNSLEKSNGTKFGK